MPNRLLVLPAAAAVIAGLCAYKLSQPQDMRTFVPPPLLVALPEQLSFDLFDQQKPPERVRLRSYLGRHPIVIVFFDPEAGADRDDVLVRLRRDWDRVRSAGLIALGVSTALPQENRPVAENAPSLHRASPDRSPFPFPLLTDLKPECRVHRLWGRYEAPQQRTIPGVFLIDRAGQVAWDRSRDKPRPLEHPQQVLDELLGTD
jgi:peroxiredoxin